MIRTPNEPDDVLLRMNLGHPVNRKTPEQQTAEREGRQPFTDYVDIPGRPGWQTDGFGHDRYDGLPDAQRHAQAEEKRLAGLDLARCEQTPLDVLQRFNEANDAKDVDAVVNAAAAAAQMPTWLLEGRRSPFRQFNEHANELMNAGTRSLFGVPLLRGMRVEEKSGAPGVIQLNVPRRHVGTEALVRFLNDVHRARHVGTTMQMEIVSDAAERDDRLDALHYSLEARLQHQASIGRTVHKPNPWKVAKADPKVRLQKHYRRKSSDTDPVHVFEMSNNTLTFSEPIDGVTLGLCNGADTGCSDVGPLVNWDYDAFHIRRPELKRYLAELRRVLPDDVPLYHQCSLDGRIRLYTKRE